MVSMIIADDELIIRQGLLTIPWKEYGIEVLGAAANGDEALAMVKASHPQILLTDIRMPGIDGLDLIEAVKMEMPEIKAILLTGYQDFNYARTALHLGALGYVLKPSDPDEILEVVLKAKKQVECELKEKLETEEFKQQAANAKTAVLNSFIQDLLYGRLTDNEQIMKRCKEYNHSLNNYAVMLIELDSGNGSENSSLVCKILSEINNFASANNQCMVLHISPAVCCIVNEMPSGEIAAKEQMLSMAMEIRNRIKSMFDIYVSIGISRNSKSPADMHKLLNQAMNCLKMRFSIGKGAIIHVEDLKDSLDRQNLNAIKITDEILESIKTGNYRKMEKLTRELLYRLAQEQKADEQIIKSVCFDLLASSIRTLKDSKAFETAGLEEHTLYSMLTECKDIVELEEHVINALMNLMDSMYSKAPAARNKVVRDVLDYIEMNYMEDISLVTAAEHVHMSHIYISRLIKKETGETFLDALTRIRMKKACELVSNSDYKTYEISYMVGIKDAGYFSQVFKKYYGATPSEYKEIQYARYNKV